MKIPKRFKLLGQTIEVEFNSQVDFRNDNRGESQFRINKIVLAPSSESTPRPVAHVEQTFCHELVHYLAFHAGLHDLNSNERDVDLLGSLLHQALTTMEYK